MIWYRRSIYVFSGIFVLIGLALLVVTAINGGGLVGFLLGALFVALNVLEVPLGRPLDDDLAELEDAANDELDEAIAIGDSYGIRVLDRLVRARSAGPAIVEEAERRGSEIIVIGTPRKALTVTQRALFGRTVDYVLRHAPCRVMVTASRDEATA